ncbi:hypothetical protein GW915_13820 [bacterium]|nr:hypothetical protein [bacterium]
MPSVVAEYRKVLSLLDECPIRQNQSESFDNVQYAIKRFGFDIDPKKVIVVSGSNGKGSVCATLEALIKETGARVGTVISPHLIEPTERIRINGRDVSRSMFCDAYKAVTDEFSETELSYIEVMTLMAVWVFFSGKSSAPVDWAIFEVSVGGLWDVANAIPHKNCVISRLGSDHEHLLGKSLQDIAKHKYGIVSRYARVVNLSPPKKLQPLISAIKEKTKSKWESIEDVDFEVIYRKREVNFSVISPWGQSEINLPGRRGVENTMLALKMFEVLGFDPSQYLGALKKINWSCRMQRFEVEDCPCPCPLFLSGDHNLQGIESLIELLDYYPRKKLHVLVSLSAGRDVDEILKPLFSIPGAVVYLTRSPYKGMTLTAYKKWNKKAAGAWANPGLALDKIKRKASKEDMIVVTGSLYLVGKIKEIVTTKTGKKTRPTAPRLELLR